MADQLINYQKITIYFDGVLYSWGRTGGVLRYFGELIKYLSKKNNVTVVMREPNYGLDLPSNVNVVNVKLFGIKWPDFLVGYVRKIFTPFNNYKVNKYFSRISDGVFHSTYFTTYKSLKIPQVLTVHDMIYEKFPEFFSGASHKRFIRNKKLCIDRADAIICVSEATKHSIKELYQVSDDKLHVIYHGVSEAFNLDRDQKVFDDIVNKLSIKNPFFLFVGVRGAYKNFSFFIKSFSKWSNNKKYDIVVVGGGPMTDDEKDLIESLGLSDQVKHHPFVSEIQLKNLYCYCQAFVFPSLDEGFGLPLLEAVSCGAIVLASDIEVFREVIDDIPIYFDPTSEDSLVKALEESSGRVKDHVMAEKKSTEIHDKFSWSVCAKRTEDLYHKLLEKRGKNFNLNNSE